MDSTLTISTTFLSFSKSNHIFPSNPNFLPSKTLLKPSSRISISPNFSCNHTIKASNNETPFAKTPKSVSITAILTVAATLMAVKFSEMPVKAETLTPTSEESTEKDENFDGVNESVNEKDENFDGVNVSVIEKDENFDEVKTPLSKLIESNDEIVENLRSLLNQKLENGEDEEASNILRKLVESQPNEIEWKFTLARLLIEMGKTQESREVFEDILALNPLSIEALFENALLMDRCGEEKAVLSRLEKALTIANEENKAKEARDVRFIIAQMQFLQKNVEEALNSYDELGKEDPKDFRPYFCKGMIYSLLDRNDEAKEQFTKYKQLSPKNFEVEGYLKSPLSKIKLFETGSSNSV